MALSDLPNLRGARVLDYGCGECPYEHELAAAGCDVCKVDMSGNVGADVWIDEVPCLPFAAGVFTGVTSFQVLEHVRSPQKYLAECARVLASGGVLIVSVPFFWPYHPHPQDYRRWTLAGLTEDLKAAGFAVQSSVPILNPVASALQVLASIVNYASKGRWWRGLVVPLFVVSNMMIVGAESAAGWSYRYGAGNILVVGRRLAC